MALPLDVPVDGRGGYRRPPEKVGVVSFGWTKESSESYGLELDVRQTGIIAQQVGSICSSRLGRRRLAGSGKRQPKKDGRESSPLLVRRRRWEKRARNKATQVLCAMRLKINLEVCKSFPIPSFRWIFVCCPVVAGK